jgi:heterodisulfide reductase subunit A
MSAIKNALLIKEKHPATDVTIYYIDIRAGGDGYEQYYIRAMYTGCAKRSASSNRSRC